MDALAPKHCLEHIKTMCICENQPSSQNPVVRLVREPVCTVLNRFEPLIYKHVSAQLISKRQSNNRLLAHSHTQSNMMHELPGPPVPKRKPHSSKKCFDFGNATGRFCAEEHC